VLTTPRTPRTPGARDNGKDGETHDAPTFKSSYSTGLFPQNSGPVTESWTEVRCRLLLQNKQRAAVARRAPSPPPAAGQRGATQWRPRRAGARIHAAGARQQRAAPRAPAPALRMR
jgi:hypothetical protein